MWLIFVSLAWGASPFPSTVRDLDVGNAHVIAKVGRIRLIRGMAPGTKLTELVDAGISRVLIFKNEIKDEVSEEKAKLRKLGFEKEDIAHISFKWKDLPNDRTVCRQIVDGLNFLQNSLHDGKSAYFHCTVGEDRTGLLAGIYRMVFNHWSREKAFQNEMCRWGYERGNPAKPPEVVTAIVRELTPVFLAFAKWKSEGLLDELELGICDQADFSAEDASFVCKPSPKANK